MGDERNKFHSDLESYTWEKNYEIKGRQNHPVSDFNVRNHVTAHPRLFRFIFVGLVPLFYARTIKENLAAPWKI